MLVLSRKAGQTILIGGGITLVVIETKGKAVRLGIDAPRAVRIVRGEIVAHCPNTDPNAKPLAPDGP